MNAKELRRLANTVDVLDSSEVIALANHILATVREDDDEPYDKEWGRKMVGASAVTLNELFSLDTDRCDIEYDDVRPGQVSYGSLWAKVKTRGEFRALCRLLGVKLKEDV